MPRGTERELELYDFSKSPDGEDCLEKTYYFTKYGAVSGAIFSFYEMVLMSRPTTLYGCIGRFGRFTLPFAGMGFVFGSSLCLLGQIRKKNDVANSVIAGAAAGSVWGFKFNSIATGHRMGIFVGAVAGYLKYFEINNLPTFTMRPEYKDAQYSFLDWSVKMFEDPGRPREP